MRDAFALMDATMARVKDNRGVMAAAAKLGQQSVQKRILYEKRGPDGVAWKSWSPLTLVDRKRRGTASRGLLFDSGSLLGSIGAKSTLFKAEVSTKLNYARPLQEGTKRMPARPFMGWDEETVRGVEALFKAWIEGGKS